MEKKPLLSNSGVCWIDENCQCRIFEKNYGQSKIPLHERLDSTGRQFSNKTYRFHPTYLQISLMINSQPISIHPNSAGIAANQIQRFLTFFLAVNKGFFKLRKKKDVGQASKALQEPILRRPCLSAATGRLCRAEAEYYNEHIAFVHLREGFKTPGNRIRLLRWGEGGGVLIRKKYTIICYILRWKYYVFSAKNADVCCKRLCLVDADNCNE